MPTHTKTNQNYILVPIILHHIVALFTDFTLLYYAMRCVCVSLVLFIPAIEDFLDPAIEDDISSSFGKGVIGSRSSKSQILTVLSSDPETKTLSSGAMAKQLIPSS